MKKMFLAELLLRALNSILRRKGYVEVKPVEENPVQEVSLTSIMKLATHVYPDGAFIVSTEAGGRVGLSKKKNGCNVVVANVFAKNGKIEIVEKWDSLCKVPIEWHEVVRRDLIELLEFVERRYILSEKDGHNSEATRFTGSVFQESRLLDSQVPPKDHRQVIPAWKYLNFIRELEIEGEKRFRESELFFTIRGLRVIIRNGKRQMVDVGGKPVDATAVAQLSVTQNTAVISYNKKTFEGVRELGKSVPKVIEQLRELEDAFGKEFIWFPEESFMRISDQNKIHRIIQETVEE